MLCFFLSTSIIVDYDTHSKNHNKPIIVLKLKYSNLTTLFAYYSIVKIVIMINKKNAIIALFFFDPF